MVYRALVFGAVLWDILGDKEYIGGAPFNVAAHLAKLGFSSTLISSVGADERGRKALDEMERMGVHTELVGVDPESVTGYVEVTFKEDGSPAYFLPENVAYDKISYTDALRKSVESKEWDIFCFGSFDQRTQTNRNTLASILASVSARYIFFDVNLREPHYSKNIIHESLKKADIVKMNEEEANLLCSMFYGAELGEKDFVATLRRDFSIDTLIITKGSKGCVVYESSGMAIIPGKEVPVRDTIGAGDAFCAAFLWSYIRNRDAEKSCACGNMLGAYVASNTGAVPEYSTEIRRAFLIGT